MKTKALFLIILAFTGASGCSGKYYALKTQIAASSSVEEIFLAAADIAEADISLEQKRKLSGKLFKKAIRVFKDYGEAIAEGSAVPHKEEIIKMLKFLRKNADGGSEEIIKEARETANALVFILMTIWADKIQPDF